MLKIRNAEMGSWTAKGGDIKYSTFNSEQPMKAKATEIIRE
jgi:hypothetical protein